MASVLCTLADLAATGAKEIVLEKNGGRYPVLVVQWQGAVTGYVNSCPHARVPLNANPDVFFDYSRTVLFCANHGAHFDPATGLCLRGPCKGERLQVFPVAVAGDAVVVREDEPS